MKGALAAILRSLFLPAGATSGTRIVLDGVNGVISVYDANDDLRVQIGGSIALQEFLQLSSGDPQEFTRADLTPVIGGAGGTRQLELSFSPPSFPGGSRSVIFMRSASQDATVPSSISYLAPLHDFDTDSTGITPDITLAGVALPRGLVKAPAIITANFAAGTPNEADVTGLSVTWPAIAGHWYQVECHARGIATTIAGRTAAYITDQLNNHLAEDDFENSSANVVPAPVSVTTAPFKAGASGNLTRKLRCESVTGGGNWTLAATPQAYLAVYDLGGLP